MVRKRQPTDTLVSDDLEHVMPLIGGSRRATW